MITFLSHNLEKSIHVYTAQYYRNTKGAGLILLIREEDSQKVGGFIDDHGFGGIYFSSGEDVSDTEEYGHVQFSNSGLLGIDELCFYSSVEEWENS